jgi:peptidoglycan/LPS O-acetylase OafA/YrhL
VPVTWTNLLRQALMVQQWFPPERGHISWVGPAWSLSAEWLAYLLFPVIVLFVARAHHRLCARTLLLLAGLTTVPLVAGFVMRVYAELMFIPVMVLAAYLLYRSFEEPVRNMMRGMLDTQFSRVRGPVPAPPEDVQQEGREETRASPSLPA